MTFFSEFPKVQKLFLMLLVNAILIYVTIYVMLSTIFVPSPGFTKQSTISNKCGRFPEEKDIFIDNIVWQVLDTPIGFIKLLNAYVDDRWNKTEVIINANGPKMYPKPISFYCQFWYSNSDEPIIVNTSTVQSLWRPRE